MTPRLKTIGLLCIGAVAGIALSVVALAMLYFLAVKPMGKRAVETALQTNAARTPAFPAQIQRATFDANWLKGDGSKMDFSTLRGKVVVLNVWATWCPPCMAELPSLAKLAAHYAGQEDVKVVCISAEEASKIWPKMAAHEATSILYSTDGNRLPPVYETRAIPATFVISKGGEIVFKHVGMANWASDETIQFLDTLRSKGVLSAPRLLSMVPPTYPDLGDKEHMAGTVVVAFVVDQVGHVGEARVINSTNKVFDGAALAAVLQWRFEPGVRDGKPSVMKMQVPIEFHPTKQPPVQAQPTGGPM